MMAGNKFEIIKIGGLRICCCEDHTCVRTAAFLPARFVAKSKDDDWHKAIRCGRVDYNNFCELQEEKVERIS